MKNKQEIWTAIIISGYSKKMNINVSEAAQILLSADCLNYLEDYYKTLHLLSNEDIISELADMAETGAKK